MLCCEHAVPRHLLMRAVERESESKDALTQQKRKITRQWEVLARLKQRHAAGDARAAADNARLSEEYQAVARAFNHLQSKFQHFKAADLARFDKASSGAGSNRWLAIVQRAGSCAACQQLVGKTTSLECPVGLRHVPPRLPACPGLPGLPCLSNACLPCPADPRHEGGGAWGAAG